VISCTTCKYLVTIFIGLLFFKILYSKEKLMWKTKMDYLITSKTIEFSSFKIIDASLQPNSTNRCVNNNCSHICIHINTNEYRCIYPQIKLQNDTKTCTQSVCIHNINVLNLFSNKYFTFTTKWSIIHQIVN
jgi:hypothetical protein